MRIRKIVAFDFDDTLAVTESQIAIQRLDASGGIDPTFEDWLLDRNIQISETTGGSENTFYWLDSANFALYEEFAQEQEFNDIIDYVGTSSFNVDTVEMIQPMVTKLIEAEADPNTLALIITARSGRISLDSPAKGGTVKPQNRHQILQVLKDNGVSLSANQLYTVGDVDAPSPAAKAAVLSRYLEKYKPDELIFYDDNENNVRAVAELCKRFAPSVRITAYRVADGAISSPSGCNEVVKLRRKKIFSRTGRYY